MKTQKRNELGIIFCTGLAFGLLGILGFLSLSFVFVMKETPHRITKDTGMAVVYMIFGFVLVIADLVCPRIKRSLPKLVKKIRFRRMRVAVRT
ncbi:hypothetical protein KW782_02515 [Candidatus Parcubacteria bacterium]|nr:hypothetical protein [Candidatus Parcubacteria bacterium]